jgi:hypothetical protein
MKGFKLIDKKLIDRVKPRVIDLYKPNISGLHILLNKPPRRFDVDISYLVDRLGRVGP